MSVGDNELYIFTEAKALLETVPGVKRVEMWNNQIDKEDKGDVGIYPAVFLEMRSGNFMNIGGDCGHQLYDCTITLHVAFEQYKDNSVDVLPLKQLIFSIFNRFEPTKTVNVGRFLRYGDEEKDSDHDNLEQYIQIYLCQNVKDYDADVLPTIPVTFTPTISPKFVANIT